MKKRHLVKKTSLILVLLMLAALLAACGQAASQAPSAPAGDAKGSSEGGSSGAGGATGEPIYVACLAPFTGNFAQYGEGYKNAIEMKFKEYNDAGGYEGRPLVLEVFDDKCEAKEAVTAAQKIVNDDRFVITLGPWSSTVGFAVGPMFAEAKMGLYGISPSHLNFVRQNDYIIRQSPNIASLMETDAKLSYMEYGNRKAAYLNYVDDAAAQSAEIFKAVWKKLGGEFVGHETFMAGAVDFSAQLTKLIAEKPEVIHVFGSYADTAKIITQSRDLGYEGRIAMTGAAMNPELINLAGEDAEGATCVLMDPNQPAAATLLAAYEKYTGGKTMDAHAFMAYEAAWHLTQAMDEVGPDRQKLVDYLRNDKNCQTTFGTVVYTDGEPAAFRFPIIVKEGRFQTIELKNCTLEELIAPIEYDYTAPPL